MSSARRKKSGSSGSGSGKSAQQPGLRQCVQRRFLKDVFEYCSTAAPGWKVLIVDQEAMRVISSAVGMYDIMERKVTLVESLEKKRAPFPDMPAIYILSPTEASVNRLVQDFAKGNVLYGKSVFIYFLSRIPEKLIDTIKSCRSLVKRLKALSEINVYFLAREERTFLLELNKDPFRSFYLRKSPSPVELVIAERLVTACATLNEYPYIRYKQTSDIGTSLASLFHHKMDEFVAANADWWYHGSGKCPRKQDERDRSTLLFLDRADDCLTPLMHDFTYQPMVRDLLTMEGDQITFQNEKAEDPSETEDKDVLLNEKDKLWIELRNKHIAQVIEILSSRIQEVVNSDTGSTLSKKKNDGGAMSLSQMASALKELPEYREVMGKLSQHMHISHSCMDKFNKNQLLDVSEVEQTLATGKDEDGKAPTLQEMIGIVEDLLVKTSDPTIRLRLVLIATISQNGLSSADRDRLLRAAQLSREQLQTLNNLETMGVSTISADAPTKAGRFFKKKLQSSGSFDEESEYASSRYVPNIKGVLRDLVNNQLSIDDYPSVVPMPESMTTPASATSARRRGKGVEGSVRKKEEAKSKWSRTGNADPIEKKSVNFSGGRNIVFMVGGLTFSEMRVTRELMEAESREVILGSTSFLSPSDFLAKLSSLTSE